MSKSKVLIIVSEFPPGPGGIGQHAFSMAETFYSLDYKVEILTSGDHASVHKIANFDNKSAYPITRFQRRGILTYLLRLVETYKVVSRFKPDRVFVSGKFPVWSLRWVRWICSSARIEVFLHGSEVNLPVWWQRMLFHWNLKQANMLYPVSQYTQSLIPDNCIHDNCSVVSNGILIRELKEWDGIPQKKLSGYPALLTVGRISRRKGQHRVVEALPRLAEVFPDVHYHIVGLSGNAGEILTLAEKLNIKERITIHGHVEERKDLAAFYKGSDCFVMLSENQPDGDIEGFGIAILEANYFGVAAIGSDEGGIVEAIKQGETGFVVDADSPLRVTEGLSKIIASAERFKYNARQWAIAHDWMQIVKKIV